MKIFITGITGFVGGSLANHLISAGHEVEGNGRKAMLPSFVSGHCTYVPEDIRHPLREVHADVLIHTAAIASDTVTTREAYDVNVRGTEHVLEASKNVRHFIHISSSSVYNFKDGKIKCESDAEVGYRELSTYGQSKWLAEQAIINNRNQIRKTILRPRAIYGKYDHLLIPRLIKLVRGNRLWVPDQLSRQISLTHIQNLLTAVDLSINNQRTDLEIFNVSDAEVYDLNIVLPALLNIVLASRLSIIRIPSVLFNIIMTLNKRLKFSSVLNPFALSSLVNRSVLNIDKISTQLQYKPVSNFFNGCEEIGDWIYREQGWRNFFKESPFIQL